MPEYIVCGTSMVVEADDEIAAVDRAQEASGWHWEAVPAERPNSGTLLPLANRRPVLMADTWLNRDGIGEGVVLAEAYEGTEWVTWHVFRHVGQTEWVAEHGDYHHNLEAAREAYNTRRQEVKRHV